MKDLISFCKRAGFVFQSSELYGGMAGFWDYGPYGVEIKNAIKNLWWKKFVQCRDDVYGIDGSIITHPKVWEASGHVANFTDPLVDCKKCKSRFRADHLVEDTLGIAADGMTLEALEETIEKNNIKCPKCGGDFTPAKKFNLMFKTHVGPVEDDTSVAYLRPETAQVIFADFKFVAEGMRAKLPFGIAQVGKAYRNEISPRNFLFRCREFEQMEIEYFIHPNEINNCPDIDEVKGIELQIFSDENQMQSKTFESMTIEAALKTGIIKTAWHAYWLGKQYEWFLELGLSPERLRLRQHLPDEKSHYALDTWDIEYRFEFGWKEIHGMANRTTFDLTQHEIHSKKDLKLFDSERNEKVLPYVVAEPSGGLDRLWLALMSEAFQKNEKDGDITLKLDRTLSPVKVAVLPLVKKDGLAEKAYTLAKELRQKFACVYDKGGSIGRRYRRQDQIGTPLCITVDYDTLKDESVTVRERDSREQKRVKIEGLKEKLARYMEHELDFEEL